MARTQALDRYAHQKGRMFSLHRTYPSAAMSQQQPKKLPTAYPHSSQAGAPSGLSRPGVKASGSLEWWCRLRDSNTRPPHYEFAGSETAKPFRGLGLSGFSGAEKQPDPPTSQTGLRAPFGRFLVYARKCGNASDFDLRHTHKSCLPSPDQAGLRAMLPARTSWRKASTEGAALRQSKPGDDGCLMCIAGTSRPSDRR